MRTVFIYLFIFFARTLLFVRAIRRNLSYSPRARWPRIPLANGALPIDVVVGYLHAICYLQIEQIVL